MLQIQVYPKRKKNSIISNLPFEKLTLYFLQVRGTTPELLAISMTAEGGCISPYRDFDVRSDRRVKAVSLCYHLNITTVCSPFLIISFHKKSIME